MPKFLLGVRRAERIRKRSIANATCRWSERGSGVPEYPLINESSAEVPHGRGNDAARTRDANHLGCNLLRIGYKLEHELREGCRECSVSTWKVASVANLELRVWQGMTSPGVGEVSAAYAHEF